MDGSVAFVADCQQYLQGYLSVLFLFIRSAFQGIPGAGRTVLTGSFDVDADICHVTEQGLCSSTLLRMLSED